MEVTLSREVSELISARACALGLSKSAVIRMLVMQALADENRPIRSATFQEIASADV